MSQPTGREALRAYVANTCSVLYFITSFAGAGFGDEPENNKEGMQEPAWEADPQNSEFYLI